jgi:ornithine cyclodeaminase
MKIFNLGEIKRYLNLDRAEAAISKGFYSYSSANTQIPKPGELLFPESSGECHIKYGHITGQPYFVIKISTGFYANNSLGLSSGDGSMQLWCATTGKLRAIFLDEGFLTDVRTALAGRIVARHLAPSVVNCIGVIGSGIQARMQVEHLKNVVECNAICVYSRNRAALNSYCEDMQNKGYVVKMVSSVEEVFAKANFVITTTPAKEALVMKEFIRPGHHITAMGSDGNGKQEIHADAFTAIDRVVVDSRSQCERLGELSYALKAGTIQEKAIHELGEVIANPKVLGRQGDDEITIADLTGVACQDIAIAVAVYEEWGASGG